MPYGVDGHKRFYGLTGGRMLDAITLNPNLGRLEKFVLVTIAGLMNTKGDYTDVRYIYASDLARRTSTSKRQVFRVLSDLETKGYVMRQRRWDANQGKSMASLYTLTDKTFYEYVEGADVKVLKKRRVSSFA